MSTSRASKRRCKVGDISFQVPTIQIAQEFAHQYFSINGRAPKYFQKFLNSPCNATIFSTDRTVLELGGKIVSSEATIVIENIGVKNEETAGAHIFVCVRGFINTVHCDGNIVLPFEQLICLRKEDVNTYGMVNTIFRSHGSWGISSKNDKKAYVN